MKIKKLNKDARLPERGSKYAAGYDLYACLNEPVTIHPNETRVIGTGIAIEMTPGLCGLIFARSGLATKQGLAPANKVGLIDEDYRGEYKVALHNHSEQERTINNGDRIAQLVFVKYETTEWEVADELNDTTRGDGGFGSTGKR